MTTTTIKQLAIATVALGLFSMMTAPAFASHGTGGDIWTQSSQKFYCESSLSNLDLTSAVNPACDVITDSAADWTNLSDPSWALTKKTSSAINQKGVNMGSSGAIGEMVHFALWGTMITAYVKYNTEVEFGDTDTDTDVYDFPTVTLHELGHLPTLFHNGHGEGSSVMKSGISLNEKRMTITSNDEAAVEAKYP